MRRGAPRGRGGTTSKGPLITNHLQGLRDIDMELELLKRKRQMMEQQHQMISANQQQFNRVTNDYEHPLYNQNFNSNHDYSYLYEDPQESRTGRKRPNVPVWENEMPSKRFSAPKRGNVRKTFGSRLGPEPNPRFESPNPRSQSNQQNFKMPWNQSVPTSSTSHRPRSYPKKPQPLMSFKFKTNSSPSVPKPNFKPNKVTKPTQSTKADDNLRNLYACSAAERKKLVAEASSLVTNVAVTSKKPFVLRADEIPTPQITGRLELALGKIMREIKDAYETRYYDLFSTTRYQRIMKQAIRERIKTVMLGKVVGQAQEILNAYRDSFPNESDKDIVDAALAAKEGPKLLMTPIDADNPEFFFKSNMYALVDIKLNEMFAKLEGVYRAEYSKPDEIKSATDSKIDANHKDNESNDWTNDVVIEEKDKDESKVSITDKYNNYIEKLMAQKLPSLLKKNIPFIIKIMKLDNMFLETEAFIKTETVNKLSPEQINAEKISEQISESEDNDIAVTTKSKHHVLHTLPYYVKIFSRPFLPKKDLMQNFLHQFNPKSIKKHKNVSNLLFVGFDNKDDFENILAATGSNIGRFQLTIKMSERANNSDEPLKCDADIGIEIKAEDLSIDENLFSPELDNQITDLLSSIRKADEQEKTHQESMEIDHPTDENKIDSIPTNTEMTEATIQIKTDRSEIHNQDENTTCDETSQNNITDIEATVKDDGTSQNEELKEQETIKIPKEITEANISEATTQIITDSSEVYRQDENMTCDETSQNNTIDIEKTVKQDEISQNKQFEQQEIRETEEFAVDRDEINKNKSMEIIETSGLEKLEDKQKESPERAAENVKKLETIAETTKDMETKTERVEALKSERKESARSTPTRSSSRLAAVTPSTIKTRRASRLAQNNPL